MVRQCEGNQTKKKIRVNNNYKRKALRGQFLDETNEVISEEKCCKISVEKQKACFYKSMFP